jgi:two-component system response regulator HydG
MSFRTGSPGPRKCDDSMVDQPPVLVGSSAAALVLDHEIVAAARSDAKVLITGESGTGKEVAARLVHERSARRQQPMVALNCAGVPDSLLESELFGHVRGSFTGAYRDKPGILETANGGTVFLDEIGEMSLRMQALLLRFLESGEVQRVGADRPTARLNLRVICATNRDLAARIKTGDFREDLFYRLNVVRIHVPPLRDRPEDVPEFLDHFIRYYSNRHRVPAPDFAPDARHLVLTYNWPGNIRELKNVVERLVVRARQEEVTLLDLPPEIRRQPASEPAAVVVPADADPREALADAMAREIFNRLTAGGRSFWNEVYEPFMSRDLTRDTLRRLVRLGLQSTSGRYRALIGLFSMERDDYKRFLNFLRKHDCLVPFHEFRGGRTPTSSDPNDRARSRAEQVA